MSSAPPFVHLGARSEASLGESIARVDELCWEATRDEQGFLALTDVNSLARAPAFAVAAARVGLRPVFGAELSVLPFGENQFRGTTFRVRLLVEDETGWRNLVRLINLARRSETIIRPPHVSCPPLLGDTRGLILLLGGEKGELTHLLREGDYGKIHDYLGAHISACGPDRVFIEFPAPVGETGPLVQALDAVASHYQLMPVAVPRVRAAHANDDAVYRFFSGDWSRSSCHQLGDLFLEEKERSHLSPRSLAGRLYKEYPRALEVSWALAQHCSAFSLPMPGKRFPMHNFSRGVDAESYIWNTAFARAADRYGDLPTRYKERLNHEFREIVEAGLANAVVSLVRLNEELERDGVQRGPGAGLLTNSVIASLLGLTRLDPLKFDLPFELPAGLGQGSFPLLELSIPSNQEGDAVEALERLFDSQVAPVGEWRGWRQSACLERIAELLGRDAKWPAACARDQRFAKALREAADQPAAWSPPREFALESPEVVAWLVNRMEGRAREVVPAQGVYTFTVEPMEVVLPQRFLPVGGESERGLPISEWQAGELGRLRHGRIAFVHAPLLELIGEATELVRQQGDFQYSPQDTAPDDAATYRILREGNTAGLAPLESPLIRRLLRQGQPTDLHSLIRLVRGKGDSTPPETVPDFATILLCHVAASIKAHRPLAFFAAALTQASGDLKRTALLLEEVRARKIEIAEIDVNYSMWHWTVEREVIRPGFSAVAGLPKSAGREIVSKRREMHFSDLADLGRRTDKARLRPAHLSLLLKAGAFDRLGPTRREVANQLEALFPLLKSRRRATTDSDELAFFDRDGGWWLREYGQVDPEDMEGEDDAAWLFAQEVESCGLPIHRVFLDSEEAYLRRARVRMPRDLSPKQVRQPATLLGVAGPVEAAGEDGSLVYADMGGVFVTAQGEDARRLVSGELGGRRLLFTGRLERDPFQWRLEDVSLTTVSEACAGAEHAAAIRLDLSGFPETQMKKLLNLLKRFPGSTPVKMEWLPVEPNRRFRSVAGRRVLLCPLLERGLDELLGAEEWSVETMDPANEAADERAGRWQSGIGPRAWQRLRSLLGT